VEQRSIEDPKETQFRITNLQSGNNVQSRSDANSQVRQVCRALSMSSECFHVILGCS
jgi:hypothetical protein